MLPIIVETSNPDLLNDYLKQFVKDRQIHAYNVFEYSPEGKEFSIREVREIIRETDHHVSEPRLFHLKNFDTASIEAQNAFLKTLEEHQEQISFVLSAERSSRLLPTIRSRSQIVLLRDPVTPTQTATVDRLVTLLQQPSVFFATLSNSVPKTEIPEVIDGLLHQYRTELSARPEAPRILKELITQRNLLKHNNVDPQTALDMILISAKRRS